MAAHALLALAALGLALVARLDGPVALVYGLIVLSGVGRAFAQPSTTTLLAQLLTPAEYQNAYAWLVSSGKIAQVAGPAARRRPDRADRRGRLVVPGRRAGQPASSSPMLAAMPGVAPAPIVGRARGSATCSAASPSSAARRSSSARSRSTSSAVLFGGAVALLPVYAKDVLMVGPAGLGVLRAAPAAGAVATALIATRLPPWRRPGRAMLIAVAGFGRRPRSSSASRATSSLSLVCLTLTGACDAISVMVRGTIEQAITPDRLRGRVSAINYLFIGLSNEMGAFESGATADLFGPVALGRRRRPRHARRRRAGAVPLPGAPARRAGRPAAARGGRARAAVLAGARAGPGLSGGAPTRRRRSARPPRSRPAAARSAPCPRRCSSRPRPGRPVRAPGLTKSSSSACSSGAWVGVVEADVGLADREPAGRAFAAARRSSVECEM